MDSTNASRYWGQPGSSWDGVMVQNSTLKVCPREQPSQCCARVLPDRLHFPYWTTALGNPAVHILKIWEDDELEPRTCACFTTCSPHMLQVVPKRPRRGTEFSLWSFFPPSRCESLLTAQQSPQFSWAALFSMAIAKLFWSQDLVSS